MNPAPMVSVIIPFYNPPLDFMREAIESVFRQQYTDWELLLVDDGSGQDSRELAHAYVAGQPEKVRYLAHPGNHNCGLSSSRQLGIDHARGKYIAWLDADDLWLPDKLAGQVALMEAYLRAGMVYGRTKYWLSWRGKPEDRKRDYYPENRFPPETMIEPPRALCSYLKGDAAVPCPSSTLMRRRVLEAVGGHDVNVPNVGEDQVLFAKITLHAPVLVSDTCWDWYRLHDTSIMAGSARAGQVEATYLAYLDWLEVYLSRQDIREPALWKALQLRRRLLQPPRNFSQAVSRRITRRMRKMILRLEKQLLPVKVRRKFWQ